MTVHRSAIWQRLFLHRFPASEGLPGFLSWRAIARRICSQLSVMVCRSRPWKPSPANWIFPPRKSGCRWESRSAASPGGARPSSSTAPELRRVQLMQLWRIAREVHCDNALAALEVLVHGEPLQAPDDLGLLGLERRASVALRVPSVVVSVESNILLNPRHPDMARVRIGSNEAFRFGWSLPTPGRPGRETPLPRSPVIKRYWRHWLWWASSRPSALASVVNSAARACIPHTNTDS